VAGGRNASPITDERKMSNDFGERSPNAVIMPRVDHRFCPLPACRAANIHPYAHGYTKARQTHYTRPGTRSRDTRDGFLLDENERAREGRMTFACHPRYRRPITQAEEENTGKSVQLRAPPSADEA